MSPVNAMIAACYKLGSIIIIKIFFPARKALNIFSRWQFVSVLAVLTDDLVSASAELDLCLPVTPPGLQVTTITGDAIATHQPPLFYWQVDRLQIKRQIFSQEPVLYKLELIRKLSDMLITSYYGSDLALIE